MVPARRRQQRDLAVATRAILGLSIALLAVGCSTTPTFGGPLQVRNQHPAQVTVMHLDPVPADVPDAGAGRAWWNSAYTSLFLGGGNGVTRFDMDGELLRTAIGTEIGLGNGLAVAVELPVLHTSGGFLDSFVIHWHDFFGFPDQGRDTAPRDEFLVETTQNGQTLWAVDDNATVVGDIPLVLRWTPWPVGDDGVGGGFRAGIEVPTAAEDRGLGNGEFDVAVGMYGELRHDFWSVTAQANHTFAGTPDSVRAGGRRFEDVTSAAVGVELAWTDDLAVLAQVEYETSTLRGIDEGLRRIADDQWLLWVGGRYRFDRYSVEVGFGEDLSGFIAPDFSAWLGLGLTFGTP